MNHLSQKSIIIGKYGIEKRVELIVMATAY